MSTSIVLLYLSLLMTCVCHIALCESNDTMSTIMIDPTEGSGQMPMSDNDTMLLTSQPAPNSTTSGVSTTVAMTTTAAVSTMTPSSTTPATCSEVSSTMTPSPTIPVFSCADYNYTAIGHWLIIFNSNCGQVDNLERRIKDNTDNICSSVTKIDANSCTIQLFAYEGSTPSLSATRDLEYIIRSSISALMLNDSTAVRLVGGSSSKSEFLGQEVWFGALILGLAILIALVLCIILLTVIGCCCRRKGKPSALKTMSRRVSRASVNYEKMTLESAPKSSCSRPLNAVELKLALADSSALQNEYEKHFKTHGLIDQEEYLTTSFSLKKAELDQSVQSQGYFINANYIKGYGSSDQNYYMVTKEPKPNQINEFWRTVWEQQVSAIVMLSNSDKNIYWPTTKDEPTKQYGDITVTIKLREIKSQYTISTLKISCQENQQLVRHFWYTNWSSHQLPQDTEAVIAFLEEVSDQKKSKPGPILVHCSDGLGCSGTLIAIDICRQQMENEHTVDVMKTLETIRKDKVGMVTNKHQYRFIYEVIHDIVAIGQERGVEAQGTAVTENMNENLVPK